MVAAVLVQLERHDRHPGQERGALLRHPAPQHQPTDPCTTLPCGTRCALPKTRQISSESWTRAGPSHRSGSLQTRPSADCEDDPEPGARQTRKEKPFTMTRD